MKKKLKIILSAGGTGGHFFPAVAVARELVKRDHEVEIVTDDRCWKYADKIHDLSFKNVNLYINSRTRIKKLFSAINVFKSIIAALVYIRKYKPDIVVGFGGYPSFPTLFAARVFNIPIIIQEQNCFLGKTNKLFANYAKIIALSYSGTLNIPHNIKLKTLYIGDIVRDEIRNMRLENMFDHQPLRIFIFGGSQSAKIFDTEIPNAIKLAKKIDPDFSCEIYQQAPEAISKDLQSTYKELGYVSTISDFYHDILSVYKKTDLVICRAGASTIAEISSLGIPAILIPFPYAAEDHQTHNANEVARIGGGWVIPQSSIIANQIALKLFDLNRNRQKLTEASKAILSRKNNGAIILADTIEKFLHQV